MLLSLTSPFLPAPPHGHVGALGELLPLLLGVGLLFLLFAASVVFNLILLGKSEVRRRPLVIASVAYSALVGLLLAGIGVVMTPNPNSSKLLAGVLLIFGPAALCLAIAVLRRSSAPSLDGGE